MRFSLIAAISGLAASSAFGQIELYRQSPQLSPGGLSSQEARNPGGLGWFSEAADDFPSQAGWTITNVQFNGGYVTPPGQPGATEGFVIRFYADNNGRPGTLLFTQESTQFNETEVGVIGNFAAYSYSCNLSPGFSPPAPGQYWFSTVCILARGGGAQEPQWGWARTTSPIQGAQGMQWFFSPGNFTPQNQDLSMILSGTVGSTCYANCDGSTIAPVLTGNDFSCFLNKFVNGDTYADCDGVGGLTANDFACFLTAYSIGCT